MLARALRSSSFSQKSRRRRLRFFVKPRTKNFYKITRARKTTLFRCAPTICHKLATRGRGEAARFFSVEAAAPSRGKGKTVRVSPPCRANRSISFARFARNQESLARGKITLLPKRTPFAENLRLTEGVKPRRGSRDVPFSAVIPSVAEESLKRGDTNTDA